MRHSRLKSVRLTEFWTHLGMAARLALFYGSTLVSSPGSRSIRPLPPDLMKTYVRPLAGGFLLVLAGFAFLTPFALNAQVAGTLNGAFDPWGFRSQRDWQLGSAEAMGVMRPSRVKPYRWASGNPK